MLPWECCTDDFVGPPPSLNSPLPHELAAEDAIRQFQVIWKEQRQHPRPSLLRTIYQLDRAWLVKAGLLYAIHVACNLGGPMLLLQLISTVGSTAEDASRNAFVFIVSYLVVAEIGSLADHQHMWIAQRTAIKVRIWCSSD